MMRIRISSFFLMQIKISRFLPAPGLIQSWELERGKDGVNFVLCFLFLVVNFSSASFLPLLVLCSFSLILVHLCSGVDVPWVSDSQMLDFSLLGCSVGFRTPFPKRVSGTACCIVPWLVGSPSYWPFTLPFPWASCSWDRFAFGVESF